jgi:hypothetical protein
MKDRLNRANVKTGEATDLIAERVLISRDSRFAQDAATSDYLRTRAQFNDKPKAQSPAIVPTITRKASVKNSASQCREKRNTNSMYAIIKCFSTFIPHSKHKSRTDLHGHDIHENAQGPGTENLREEKPCFLTVLFNIK